MSKEKRDTALATEQPQAEVRPNPEQPSPEAPEQKAPKALPTPWDYGRETGLILPDGRRKPEFRAAETLHGWSAHHLHTADPLHITREAFDAAILAAGKADKSGNYTPHAAALAPHLQPKGDV